MTETEACADKSFKDYITKIEEEAYEIHCKENNIPIDDAEHRKNVVNHPQHYG